MESIEKLRGLIKTARNGWYSYNGALYDDVEKAADEIEREIADNYMKLPLDENGVPIHVGDKMLDDIQREVVAVSESSFVLSGYGIGCNLRLCGAHLHSHVKPRTIEDVLYDFGRDERWNDEGDSAAVEREIIAKYASEIHELVKKEV